MRVDRRVGPAGRAAAALWAVAGCLSGPGIVETTGTSGATTDAAASSTGAPATEGPTEAAPVTASEGPRCDDGAQSGDESDVDCGGSCSPCPDGQACLAPGDCAGGLCEAGECASPDCLVDADCEGRGPPCTRALCDPQRRACTAAPSDEDEPCEDGDPCTVGDACQAGRCAPGSAPDCSAYTTSCTEGACDPRTGACLAIDLPDGTDCDDGDGCTLGEACTAGACTPPPGEGALFHADFADARGWTLDAPWQIGAAAASPAGVGGADPDADHSEGDDEGLAGTAIGGLDPLPSHARACLTSPEVDTSAVMGTLWLSFWRHLHTPPSPGVISTIEVWNGAAWKSLQTGFVATVNDPAWTFQKFNVTGNHSADFKVRICMEREDGAPEVAGWSVDDLTVAPIACTP